MTERPDGRFPGQRFVKPLLSGAGVLALTLALGGCDTSSVSVVDADPAAPQSTADAEARASTDAQVAADADAPAPDLRNVPDRPPGAPPATTRERVVDGLVADRENARYTDDNIRLQGTGRAVTPATTAVTPSTSAGSQSAKAEPATVPPPAPPAPPPAPSAGPATVAAASAAAVPPAAPRAPTPVPPPPSSAAQGAVAPPAPPTPVPPPLTAASAAAAAGRAAVPAAVPAAAPATATSDAAVVVDRSVLNSIGTPGAASGPLSAPTGSQIATIQFGHSSASLDGNDKEVLRQVAALQRQSGGTLLVVGHASSRTRQLDKTVHQLANLNISMARANAVADVLVASGVAREQLTVEAIADRQPMFIEAMPTGEAGNRRTEIFLVQ